MAVSMNQTEEYALGMALPAVIDAVDGRAPPTNQSVSTSRYIYFTQKKHCTVPPPKLRTFA